MKRVKNMMQKLSISEIDDIIKILHQDGVRSYNGQFIDTEYEWFAHFFDPKETNCFTYGWYIDKKLVAVLIAETITGNGCMLWYIAVELEKQNKGYGTMLLQSFEEYAKTLGVEWIYLTAPKNSLEFYKKNQYITSNYSIVHEHVKIF